MIVETVAMTIAMPILIVAIALTFFRLVRGPSLPDRVVALDVMAILGIGIVSVYGMASGQAVFLDVAIVLALISFLGTVAFALYLERKV